MEDRSLLKPGTPATIAPGVRRLVAGNAGMMTGPGTNTYLLGDEQVAVLDPGPAQQEHLRAILAAAGGAIRWILATHTHPDHSPLAQELARATGAELIGLPPPDDGRQDLSFRPQRVPSDGEVLALGTMRLAAIRTPGHASNCVCYLHEQARLLFSGDHVLEGVTPVILPPDGDMSDYLDSIAKLEPLSFDRIAPGHGAVIGQGKSMLAMLRKHRLMREAKVIAALRARRPASIEALTPRVYDDVPAERHGWAKLTLEAHLRKLAREGRATLDGTTWSLRGE
ncbi:MAG: MBL fold metallo-hydrolase [Proteobacteria bacterium]|nr:MBL fold metallo-hydrolase [Pseudomonadota bacterium]